MATLAAIFRQYRQELDRFPCPRFSRDKPEFSDARERRDSGSRPRERGEILKRSKNCCAAHPNGSALRGTTFSRCNYDADARGYSARSNSSSLQACSSNRPSARTVGHDCACAIRSAAAQQHEGSVNGDLGRITSMTRGMAIFASTMTTGLSSTNPRVGDIQHRLRYSILKAMQCIPVVVCRCILRTTSSFTAASSKHRGVAGYKTRLASAAASARHGDPNVV